MCVLRGTRLPLMIHPEFSNQRRIRFPGLEPAEFPSTGRTLPAVASAP